MLRFNQQDTGDALSQKAGDAIRGKLIAAINAVPEELTIWKMFFYLTEADLYLAQHDIEGSAKTGKQALKVAKAVNSTRGKDTVKTLYTDLRKRSPNNPYVDNLGVALGMF